MPLENTAGDEKVGAVKPSAQGPPPAGKRSARLLGWESRRIGSSLPRREGPLGGVGQPCRAFTLLASADFLFAAWLAWMTPLEAALSSWREAAWASSCAFATSPDSTASRVLRIAVFSEDLTALLRRRAFSFVLIRLIWDLMFATERCLCLVR